jgi:O-antigen/teichoic acid export membrane protein
MAKNRTAYAMNNIFWGIFNKIINIVFPFVIRSVIIYVLGTEYLGLNTLFSSILQVLNLAEMGISSAIVYSMYKPIANNNKPEVCALLNIYKKIYRVIGVIVFTVGLLFVPFLQNMINGSYPEDANLTVLYFVYLINTTISYYFFSYKAALLNACQQVSSVYNINTIIMSVQSIAQIIVLLVFKNYLLFILLLPLFTLINNLLIGYVSYKKYPEYIPSGKVQKDVIQSIKKRVAGLFITKICTTTRNALDSIFISAMIGLSAVAIYGNYYYIMGAIFGLVSIIVTSMTASIGNSMAKESVKKNYDDMRKIDFGFSWISGLCTIALLCLYQPFMKLWVGENLLFPYHMVILFALYFYTLCAGSIRAAYHDAAGLWWEARYRAILETIVNIALNFVLTLTMGVAGTVLSTIISIILINFGYGTSIVFKNYFKGISMKQYFIDHLKYLIITIIVATITVMLCNLITIDGVFEVVIKGIVCFVVSNLMFYLVYRKTNLFKSSLGILKNVKR